MIQCPDCRSYNDVGASFCSQCGGKIARTTTAARRQHRAKGSEDSRRGGRRASRSRVIVRVLLVFFAVGLTAAYLIVWTHRLDDRGASNPVVSDQALTEAASGESVDGDQQISADPSADLVESADEPLTQEELLKRVKTAFVSLDLSDADGDPLKAVRGVLVSPRGVVLTRLSRLFGATSGGARVGGRDGRFEILGSPQIDPLRDLALLLIDDTSTRDVTNDEAVRVFPALSVLLSGQSNELLERGRELFVASEQSGAFTTVSEFPHFSFDQVGRARVAQEAGLPRNPLVAVDEYGYVAGMCRLDTPELEGQEPRILVEPIDRLVNSLDLQPVLSLGQISEQYFDGSYAALLARAEKALKAQDWRLASGRLLVAIDQAVREKISDEELAPAVELLRKSTRTLLPDLARDGHTGELVTLAEQAVVYLPGERDVWLALAGVYVRGVSYDNAIRTAREAGRIRAGPDVDAIIQECYLKLAEQSAITGDLSGSAEILLEGIEHVRSGKLHFELAKIYEAWDYYEDAVRVFQMAAALDPRMNAEVEIYLEKIDAAIKRRESVVIPLEPGSSVHKTKALVNGRDNYEFIIDTGATYTAISASVARSLGVQIGAGTPRIAVSTANGRIMAPLVELESLAIQGFTIHSLKALVLTNHRSDLGLLGLNFLNHFKYTFDNSRGELILQQR